MGHETLYQRTLLRILVLCAVTLAGACSDEDTGEQDNPLTGDDASMPDAGDGDAGDGDDGDGDGEPSVGPNPDGTDNLAPLPEDKTLPIVFVHGFAGSAQQYESQAIRFVANGYPQDRIYAFDHDGAGFAIAEYVQGVDDTVDQAMEDHGTDQVYLVGHSRGTAVSNNYLSDETRRAKIAKYIAIDGSPCPTTVECMAPTQAKIPGQAHVEVATSAESFVMQYEFLLGETPEVVDIVPQKDPVVISGRAVNFPANTGRDGAELNIYEIDHETAERVGDEPIATFTIGADGDWGPVTVDSRKHYEFQLGQPDGSTFQHLYLQRFLRDSHLVRLLSGPPDSDSRVNSNITPDHTNLIIMRMREWYADSDVLEIETSSDAGDEDAVNVITADVGMGNIALHIHDDAATPEETTLDPLPWFPMQAFQTGLDVFMPAADPPNGTITLTNLPRGDEEAPQVLRARNWASENHTVSIMFADFAQ